MKTITKQGCSIHYCIYILFFLNVKFDTESITFNNDNRVKCELLILDIFSVFLPKQKINLSSLFSPNYLDNRLLFLAQLSR